MTLDQLIEPVSKEDFFSKNWMKEPLYISGGNTFEEVIDVTQINNFLVTQVLTYPFIRLVGNGAELPLTEYIISANNTFNVLNKERVFQLFEQGNSIVIQGAQYQFENLKRLTRSLSKELKGDINANIYITPQKSQGFHPHFDTHEVIVLQIFGSKTWRLYDKDCSFPLKNWKLTLNKQQEYVNSLPAHEFKVEAGDILYFPAGVVHDAFCDDDLSIHITLGIKSPTKLDYLEKILKEAEKIDFFRTPFDASGDGIKLLQENFSNLINKFTTTLERPNTESSLSSSLFIDYCCIDNITKLDNSDFKIGVSNFVPSNGEESSLISSIENNELIEFFEKLDEAGKVKHSKYLKALLRKNIVKINN